MLLTFYLVDASSILLISNKSNRNLNMIFIFRKINIATGLVIKKKNDRGLVNFVVTKYLNIFRIIGIKITKNLLVVNDYILFKTLKRIYKK